MLGGFVREIRIAQASGEGWIERPSTVLVPGVGQLAWQSGGDKWRKWQEDAFAEIVYSLSGPIAEQLYVYGDTQKCTIDDLLDNEMYWADLDYARDVVSTWQNVREPNQDYEPIVPPEAVELALSLAQRGANEIKEIAERLVADGSLTSKELPKVASVRDCLSGLDLDNMV
jgi:hypothetical protein